MLERLTLRQRDKVALAFLTAAS